MLLLALYRWILQPQTAVPGDLAIHLESCAAADVVSLDPVATNTAVPGDLAIELERETSGFPAAGVELPEPREELQPLKSLQYLISLYKFCIQYPLLSV